MIYIPASIGEVIDKLSILHIKKTKILDPEKKENIIKEFELIYNISCEFLNDMSIENLYHELVKVNNLIWDLKSRQSELIELLKFQGEFIDVSKKIQRNNLLRNEIKNQINLLSSSELMNNTEFSK